MPLDIFFLCFAFFLFGVLSATMIFSHLDSSDTKPKPEEPHEAYRARMNREWAMTKPNAVRETIHYGPEQ